MDFTVAIKNKYISNYKIYLPSVSEDYCILNDKINEEIRKYKDNVTDNVKINTK